MLSRTEKYGYLLGYLAKSAGVPPKKPVSVKPPPPKPAPKPVKTKPFDAAGGDVDANAMLPDAEKGGKGVQKSVPFEKE